MFQFPAFASNPYVFRVRYLIIDTWKPVVFVVSSVVLSSRCRQLRCLRSRQGAGRPAEASRPLGSCPRCRSIRQTSKDQTEQIFQVSKVGFPIRRSMDQSLFAAPHSLSQRITSFFACACQGIHQMPLRHLIVLIANDHHLSSSETHATFYNACHHDDTSISSSMAAYPGTRRAFQSTID